MKPSELFKTYLDQADRHYEGYIEWAKYEQEQKVRLKEELRECGDRYSSLLARLIGYLLIKHPQIAEDLNYVLNAPPVGVGEIGLLAIESALKALNDKDHEDI